MLGKVRKAVVTWHGQSYSASVTAIIFWSKASRLASDVQPTVDDLFKLSVAGSGDRESKEVPFGAASAASIAFLELVCAAHRPLAPKRCVMD